MIVNAAFRFFAAGVLLLASITAGAVTVGGGGSLPEPDPELCPTLPIGEVCAVVPPPAPNVIAVSTGPLFIVELLNPTNDATLLFDISVTGNLYTDLSAIDTSTDPDVVMLGIDTYFQGNQVAIYDRSWSFDLSSGPRTTLVADGSVPLILDGNVLIWSRGAFAGGSYVATEDLYIGDFSSAVIPLPAPILLLGAALLTLMSRRRTVFA